MKQFSLRAFSNFSITHVQQQSFSNQFCHDHWDSYFFVFVYGRVKSVCVLSLISLLNHVLGESYFEVQRKIRSSE